MYSSAWLKMHFKHNLKNDPVQAPPPKLEGSDKWVMSKFRQTTILRPFFDIFERLPKTQNFFFEKLPPCTAKTVFENPKGPPFGC